MPEVLLGLPQIVPSAAGICEMGRCKRDQVIGSRHPGIAVGDAPGKGGQTARLLRIFLDPLAALLDQEPHERRAPETAPGAFHPLDALLRGERQEILQILQRPLLILLDPGDLLFQDSWKKLDSPAGARCRRSAALLLEPGESPAGRSGRGS